MSKKNQGLNFFDLEWNILEKFLTQCAKENEKGKLFFWNPPPLDTGALICLKDEPALFGSNV